MAKKTIDPKAAKQQSVITAVINLIAPSVDAEGRKQTNANRIITAAQYAPTYKIENGKFVIDKEASCKMPSKVTIDGETISLNPNQYKAIRNSIALHCDFCSKVVCIYNHTGKPFPITYMVYYVLGKQSHRTSFFESGIKSFGILEDSNGVKRTLSLADFLAITTITVAYSRYNGNKGVDADLLHGIVKYYAETGISAESFIDDVLPHVKKNNSEGCEQTYQFCMEATRKAGLIVEEEAPEEVAALAETMAQ